MSILKAIYSLRQLAERFCVALSFIQKLIKQYRETGNLAPKIRTQQTPSKLQEKERKLLQELVEAKNDATLEELRHELAASTGVFVSCPTIYRQLRPLNLTVKKHTTRHRERN